jgi:hypothetical protein
VRYGGCNYLCAVRQARRFIHNHLCLHHILHNWHALPCVRAKGMLNDTSQGFVSAAYLVFIHAFKSQDRIYGIVTMLWTGRPGV